MRRSLWGSQKFLKRVDRNSLSPQVFNVLYHSAAQLPDHLHCLPQCNASCFNVHDHPGGRDCCSHLIYEETGAEKSEVIGPRTRSHEIEELRLQLRASVTGLSRDLGSLIKCWWQIHWDWGDRASHFSSLWWQSVEVAEWGCFVMLESHEMSVPFF